MPTSPETTPPIVEELLARRPDAGPRLRLLVECSIGRILRRDARRAGGGMPDVDRTSLEHVVDWLRAADLADAWWIARTDLKGRPSKLMKLGTIEACVAEADKAVRLANAAPRPEGLGPEDETVEWDAGGGWTVVRLLSEKALDLESVRMGHCIGNGAYDGELRSPDVAFLSLRGPNGEPHATMEIGIDRKEDGRGEVVVAQVQGRGNSPLAFRHRLRTAGFLAAYGIAVPDGFDEGLWIDGLGGVFPATDVGGLPDGSRIAGNVSIFGKAPTRLPSDLLVDGDLSIRGADVRELPPGLRVTGSLTLADLPQLVRLPEDMRVGGFLSVYCCGLEEVLSTHGASGIMLELTAPGKCRRVVLGGRVEGSVDVSGVGELELAPGFSGGRMRFVRCARVGIGDGVSSGNGVVVRYAESLRVGSAFRTGEEFAAEAVRDVSVGRDIVVGGDFGIIGHIGRIDGTRAHPAPFRISFDGGAEIGGEASLCRFDAACLPDPLRVGKDLTLRDLVGPDLPRSLRVGGGLKVQNVPVRALGAGHVVAGDVDLVATSIEGIDGFVPNGRLSIAGAPLSLLPGGLRVPGRLLVVRTALRGLPARLRVEGDLEIQTEACAVPADASIAGVVRRVPDDRFKWLDDENASVLDTLMWSIGELLPEVDPIGRLGTPKGPVGRFVHQLRAGYAPRPFRGRPENSDRYAGALVDADGALHPMWSLPEGLVVDGDLDLSRESCHLPEGAVVRGTLRIADCANPILPDGLVVEGDLVISSRTGCRNTGWFGMSGNVRVDGSVFLRNVRPTVAPEGSLLEVGRDLVLAGGRGRRSFAESWTFAVRVAGRIDMRRGNGGDLGPHVVARRGVLAGAPIRVERRLSHAPDFDGPVCRVVDALHMAKIWIDGARRAGTKKKPHFLDEIRPRQERR